MEPISYRLQSDKRQFGGMLMLLGFCAVIQPLTGIVSAFGPEGANTTDPSLIPFWGMIGAFCLFVNGVGAVITGFAANTLDFSHRHITLFLIVIIQTAFIPYITNMTNVGKLSKLPANGQFIPLEYEPTDTDVKFVGAMGIAAIASYGFAFVGGISFMVFCLHAYNSGKPEERSGAYFQGRLGFYSGILALGGLAQLLLGAYCRINFGTELGPKPVAVAMLIVVFPSLSIAIGFLQVMMGLWGAVRSMGYHQGANDCSFQIFLALQWVVVLAGQWITQIGYLPGGEQAGAAPTFAAMSVAINLMPAFLDHKMRSLPAQFPLDYYAVPKSCEGSENAMTKDSGSFDHSLDWDKDHKIVETVDV